METARDKARKDRAWDLHHDNERPYFVKAL